MTLIADVLLKLGIPKNVLRKMSKMLRFRAAFDNQHSKWEQTLLKSE